MPHVDDYVGGSTGDYEKPSNGKHPKKHIKTKKADKHKITKPKPKKE